MRVPGGPKATRERLSSPPALTWCSAATWLVTAAPVLTGLLTVAHLGGRYETLLAIHILSFSVFLIWFPFGKLTHSFVVFGSRYTTGLTFTRRGAKV